MSVYTTVEATPLEKFLQRYALGKLVDFSPITAGITNTNYSLDTTQGRFVLTLYEHHSDDELVYLLKLQRHLVNQSVHCSEPVKDRRGELFSSLKQRPAAIIQRLEGQVQTSPGPHQCALIGAELARFHLAGQDFAGNRPNPRGTDWIIAVSDMLDSSLTRNDQQLIGTTLQAVTRVDLEKLPGGAIHADLFRDNVLFVDNDLGGILDFDYACSDCFVFDIAVLINDWCSGDQYELIESRVMAILEAYQQVRRLEPSEIEALPLMLRITALRFWLSRLYDAIFPPGGELTFTKNPGDLRELLLQRNSQQQEIENLLHAHCLA